MLEQELRFVILQQIKCRDEKGDTITLHNTFNCTPGMTSHTRRIIKYPPRQKNRLHIRSVFEYLNGDAAIELSAYYNTGHHCL